MFISIVYEFRQTFCNLLIPKAINKKFDWSYTSYVDTCLYSKYTCSAIFCFEHCFRIQRTQCIMWIHTITFIWYFLGWECVRVSSHETKILFACCAADAVHVYINSYNLLNRFSCFITCSINVICGSERQT